MGFKSMVFDKDWTNPKDFPTYEARESQVREDMQYLFNFIRDHFNNFITNELVAENIPFAPTLGGTQGHSLQEAIDILQQELRDMSMGSVADGAITAEKMALDAVTTDVIADGAVTGAKIADGTITGDKIASGAFSANAIAEKTITGDKIANGAIDTDQLRNYCVDTDKLQNGIITTQKMADGAITTAKLDQREGLEAVTTATIRDKAVTTAKIADGAVGITQLATGAVTAAKIANGCISYGKTDGSIQKRHTIVGPISVAVDSWDTTTKKVNVDVAGVSLTNMATQGVHWGPANDDSWNLVTDCRVRCDHTPPENGKVTLICDVIPDASISLYFDIFD